MQNPLGRVDTSTKRCMAEMRHAGATTIAQDEETCVVYGMPHEAVRHGGVVRSEPLGKIAASIMDFARRHEAAGGTW